MYAIIIFATQNDMFTIHSDAFTAYNDIYHYDDIYYACVHESISLWFWLYK